MSTQHNIATISRITGPDLATLLLSPTTSGTTAIVDVRDDDHVGGHIKSSIHAPTPSLDHRIPQLVRTMAEKKIVVFHCSLSQQRGPSAALRYMRERQRKAEKGEVGGGVMTEVVREGEEGKGEGEGMVSQAAEGEQEVYVLDKGFVGWQAEYGKDERLTEGYEEDIWRE